MRLSPYLESGEGLEPVQAIESLSDSLVKEKITLLLEFLISQIPENAPRTHACMYAGQILFHSDDGAAKYGLLGHLRCLQGREIN